MDQWKRNLSVALPFTMEEYLNKSKVAYMDSKERGSKIHNSSLVLQYHPEAGMPWSGYILFYIFVFSVNTFETPNSINMEVLFYFLLVSKTSSLLLLLTECPRFTRFICWNPVHKVRILGSMALGRCSWGVSPHERDSYPFKKEAPQGSLTPSTRWQNGEKTVFCAWVYRLS